MLNIVKMYELLSVSNMVRFSMPIVEILQSWGLIANSNELKCNKGNFLLLCPILILTLWMILFGGVNKSQMILIKNK